MSEFKLNRNWNGHFAGEIVPIPNHLDGEMIRNRIGIRVDKIEVKAEIAPKNKAEKPPKNKAIQSTPRNKKK